MPSVGSLDDSAASRREVVRCLVERYPYPAHTTQNVNPQSMSGISCPQADRIVFEGLGCDFQPISPKT